MPTSKRKTRVNIRRTSSLPTRSLDAKISGKSEKKAGSVGKKNSLKGEVSTSATPKWPGKSVVQSSTRCTRSTFKAPLKDSSKEKLIAPSVVASHTRCSKDTIGHLKDPDNTDVIPVKRKAKAKGQVADDAGSTGESCSKDDGLVCSEPISYVSVTIVEDNLDSALRNSAAKSSSCKVENQANSSQMSPVTGLEYSKRRCEDTMFREYSEHKIKSTKKKGSSFKNDCPISSKRLHTEDGKAVKKNRLSLKNSKAVVKNDRLVGCEEKSDSCISSHSKVKEETDGNSSDTEYFINTSQKLISGEFLKTGEKLQELSGTGKDNCANVEKGDCSTLPLNSYEVQFIADSRKESLRKLSLSSGIVPKTFKKTSGSVSNKVTQSQGLTKTGIIPFPSQRLSSSLSTTVANNRLSKSCARAEGYPGVRSLKRDLDDFMLQTSFRQFRKHARKKKVH